MAMQTLFFQAGAKPLTFFRRFWNGSAMGAS